MRKTLTIYLITGLLIGHHLQAQDLSGLTLQAHYTLLNTADESTGTYGEMELVNAPYIDTCGVFSFGGYLFDTIDEDSSFVGTPQIDALNDDAFAVQIEFKVDSIEMRSRPVIVLGSSWRYLGLFTQSDGTFAALHNGANYTIDPPVNLESGRWHTFTVMYSSVDMTSRHYLDGALIFSRVDTLIRPDHDTYITNTHGGFGWTFRGYWRNLKVYSSNSTTATRELHLQEEMLVTPNPSNGEIMIRMPYQIGKRHQLHIYDMHGRMIRIVDMYYDEISVADLPAGVLNVLCFREGELIAQNRLLVTRD